MVFKPDTYQPASGACLVSIHTNYTYLDATLLISIFNSEICSTLGSILSHLYLWYIISSWYMQDTPKMNGKLKHSCIKLFTICGGIIGILMHSGW